MFTHLVYTLTHSLPSVPHPTTQRRNPAAGCVGWGGGAFGSTPDSSMPKPFRQSLLHLSVRPSPPRRLARGIVAATREG